MKSFFQMCTLLALVIWMTACTKEKKGSAPLPEEETLTTMRIRAVNAADASDSVTAVWQQLDLTGANPPDTGNYHLELKANTTYVLTVQVLDTTEDLTHEILDKANYHLICFEQATGLNLTVTATDVDNNSPRLRIGLINSAVTTGASTGTMKVRLKHQPTGKNGSCDVGTTDLEADFRVTVR